VTTIKRIFAATVASTVLLGGVASMPTPSQAGDGGSVALGALGGLAAGAVIGNALAGPRYYAPPPRPAYRAYYPEYAPVYEECVRHRVWGPYGWHWVTDC
jgi:hypothetical protein